MERHLAAVMIADVVGYSRLSSTDEEGTRARFRCDLSEVFQPSLARHHGRLVKTMGDGLLIEFRSVLDALQCAIEVQNAKRQRENDVPADRRLLFRIGITLGDVIVEGDDIHGTGVNIAHRLQTLSEPGGIAVSGSAYEQLRGKTDAPFVDRGLQRVKNIDEPIRVYLVQTDASARRPGAWSPLRGLSRRRMLVGMAILAAILIGGLNWWKPWTQLAPSPPTQQRLAYPLPDKPSVAVLPFINVTGDKEQDHLARGLTDDLITELSKVGGLFVIARHSASAVADAGGAIEAAAGKLGVQYVIEGTLQRAGINLRINVKLLDAMSGLSLWAERYDRQFTDLFAVQDDVIGKIISALEVRISEGERNQIERIPTDNLEAYDYYMRAEQQGPSYGNVQTYRQALSYYQKAIDLDPRFADAHAGIARIAVDIWRNDFNYIWSAAVARKIAYDAAGEALKIDPENARAHTVLALLQLVDGHGDEAEVSATRATAARPNDPEAHANLGLVLALTGSHREAIAEAEYALRLDPSPVPSFTLLAGMILYIARANDEAIPLIDTAAKELGSSETAHEFLAGAYAAAGDEKAAREEARKLQTLFPETNLTYYSHLYDYWPAQDLDYHLQHLQAAGISAWPFGIETQGPERLTGDALGNLIANRTWVGRHRNGTEFMQYFDLSGDTAYRTANTSITGKAEVSGDRLCEQFEGYFLDRMVCGYVLRNDDKLHPDMDYIHVTPQAAKYFSLAP